MFGKKYFGARFYRVKDVVEKVGPMAHVSDPDGPQRNWSYGGVIAWVSKRLGLEPARRGLYMLLESVPEANAIMEARYRARVRVRELGPLKVTKICGLELVSIEDYAAHRSMTTSNLRKFYYEQDSPLAPLFKKFDGGYVMTKEQFEELCSVIKAEGAGPRPRKFKRSSSKRRGAPLNVGIVEMARKAPEEVNLQGE